MSNHILTMPVTDDAISRIYNFQSHNSALHPSVTSTHCLEVLDWQIFVNLDVFCSIHYVYRYRLCALQLVIGLRLVSLYNIIK